MVNVDSVLIDLASSAEEGGGVSVDETMALFDCLEDGKYLIASVEGYGHEFFSVGLNDEGGFHLQIELTDRMRAAEGRACLVGDWLCDHANREDARRALLKYLTEGREATMREELGGVEWHYVDHRTDGSGYGGDTGVSQYGRSGA